MLNKQTLKLESETTQALKTLAFAYEQISVMKMQQVRKSVLTTRQFLSQLALIYFDVKQNYQMQIETLKKLNIQVSPNKTPAAVLLTTQSALSGDINHKVFTSFLSYIQKNPQIKVVILGKQGKNLMDEQNLKVNYLYFDMPEKEINFDNLQNILTAIAGFSEVEVFFGKFLNVLNQSPENLNISGKESFENAQAQKNIEPFAFRFEPSLPQILDFFESQVTATLFKQTVHESELARHGSRIKAMEDALSNIDLIEIKLKKDFRKVSALINNKKQQQTLSGMSLWRLK